MRVAYATASTIKCTASKRIRATRKTDPTDDSIDLLYLKIH